MPEIVNPKLDEVFLSPKGGKFRILVDGALYYIVMENGGLRPYFLNQKFTSYRLAKRALDQYFDENPKHVPREKIKTEE